MIGKRLCNIGDGILDSDAVSLKLLKYSELILKTKSEEIRKAIAYNAELIARLDVRVITLAGANETSDDKSPLQTQLAEISKYLHELDNSFYNYTFMNAETHSKTRTLIDALTKRFKNAERENSTNGGTP